MKYILLDMEVNGRKADNEFGSEFSELGSKQEVIRRITYRRSLDNAIALPLNRLIFFVRMFEPIGDKQPLAIDLVIGDVFGGQDPFIL